MPDTQQTIHFHARLAGFLYVLTNLTAIAAFMMRGRVLVLGDSALSKANIAAAPLLLRLSIVGELVTIAGVLVLVASSFIVLRTVNRNLALIALLWRLAENMVLAVTTLSASALVIVSNANGTIDATELIRTFTGIYGAGYMVGFFFLGLGSTLFSWLWWRSRWVPRVIAVFGILASSIMALGSLAIIANPAIRPILGMAYMAPMGIFELGLGLWLWIKGIDQTGNASSQA